jgi:hypothetical protein
MLKENKKENTESKYYGQEDRGTERQKDSQILATTFEKKNKGNKKKIRINVKHLLCLDQRIVERTQHCLSTKKQKQLNRETE